MLGSPGDTPLYTLYSNGGGYLGIDGNSPSHRPTARSPFNHMDCMPEDTGEGTLGMGGE